MQRPSDGTSDDRARKVETSCSCRPMEHQTTAPVVLATMVRQCVTAARHSSRTSGDKMPLCVFRNSFTCLPILVAERSLTLRIQRLDYTVRKQTQKHTATKQNTRRDTDPETTRDTPAHTEIIGNICRCIHILTSSFHEVVTLDYEFCVFSLF